MRAIVLRLQSPLMSFGDIIVDELGVTDLLPRLSMITGLIGNALGFDRCEGERLDALQARITYAARLDDPGERMTDYQTADLGQPFMLDAWTTRGVLGVRVGGPAVKGTHQRWRDYLAGASVTVVVALSDGDQPSLEDIASALQRPARPLFIGRKPCLPSRPLFDGFVDATTLREALERIPLMDPNSDEKTHLARWPQAEGATDGARLIHVHETRDWRNQTHIGRSAMYQGELAAGVSP